VSGVIGERVKILLSIKPVSSDDVFLFVCRASSPACLRPLFLSCSFGG